MLSQEQAHQQANLISEGALSHLINSHIHETEGGAGRPFEGNFSNASFENGGNLAFWARKQNEY